jgi:hypothetical protein
MPYGIPVGRHTIVTLKNREIVIEWDEETFQDVRTGDFVEVKPEDIDHTTMDDELELLKKNDMVEEYDNSVVFFLSLPEPPRKTID